MYPCCAVPYFTAALTLGAKEGLRFMIVALSEDLLVFILGIHLLFMGKHIIIFHLFQLQNDQTTALSYSLSDLEGLSSV